jgi:hypothetical protein
MTSAFLGGTASLFSGKDAAETESSGNNVALRSLVEKLTIFKTSTPSGIDLSETHGRS